MSTNVGQRGGNFSDLVPISFPVSIISTDMFRVCAGKRDKMELCGDAFSFSLVLEMTKKDAPRLSICL